MTIQFNIRQTVDKVRHGCLTIDDRCSVTTPALAVGFGIGDQCALTPHEWMQFNVDALVFDGQHLLARPGAELIAHRGGLARFSGFHGLIIVDLMTLPNPAKIRFRSPYDGRWLSLDEPGMIQVKRQLAADLWVLPDNFASDVTCGEAGLSVVTQLPRYTRGTTDWAAFVAAILQGYDIIYCALPGQWAAQGKLITAEALIDLNETSYATQQQPVSQQCACYVCRHYTRAYLYQLHQQDLAIGKRLNLIHNLQYFISFMQNLRNALEQGKLPAL
jgi:queuine/archaeosine tRNA-ribosyltransferase